MANYVGTVTQQLVAGDRGQPAVGLGQYALTGALVNADTITFTGFFANQKPRILGGALYAPELDTNAAPTGSVIIGDGTTTNGYMTTSLVGRPVGENKLVLRCDGTFVGTASAASKDLIVTVNGVMATSATTGTIFVEVVGVGV